MQAIADFSTEDTMPLNNTDKAWITLEIQNALQDALQRKGWGKLTGFIKDWSGTSAAVGILIFLATQWGGYIDFRAQTTSKLGNIEEKLAKIERDSAGLSENFGNLIKQNISDKAGLPQNEFDKKLAFIAGDLHSAARQGVSLDLVAVKTISKKLEKSPRETPGYWPTSGALVSVQSQIGKSMDEISRALSLPDCPRPQGGPHFEGLQQVASNCAIALDGWHYTNSVFTDVVVRYRGGGLVLQNTRFINCIFIIELPANPEPPGKVLTTQLLAQSSYANILVSSTQV